MHKFLRLMSYLKELLLMIVLRPAAFVMRKISPGYRDLWLIGERGNDARDNGYWFFRYLNETHPEINSCFVISPGSADYKKVASLGKTVKTGSFLHHLKYYAADYLIGTHIQPASPDLIIYYHLAHKGIKARGKQVFLQHGITYNKMEWLHGDKLFIDLFVTGAKPEYDFIYNNFGHREGTVKYLGFCRFDNLIRAKSAKKMILLMPTWRGSKYPSGDAFYNTAFYKSYSSLLKSKRLNEMLEKFGYELVFYPHVEMQKYINDFRSDSDRVRIADKSTDDVQALLMDCAVLITDYSSVFFDVAYLNKPVIYYQFDEVEFRKYHYSEGYFDYIRDGFGPVCESEEQLLSSLGKCLGEDARLSEEYRPRVERFFPLRDDKNSERTFEAIKGI